MIIYKKDNSVRITIHQSDNSDVKYEISSEEYANINIKSVDPIPFADGDYVTLFGQRFTLYHAATTIEKFSGEHFEYALKFESLRADLSSINFVLFDNTTDGTDPAWSISTTYGFGEKVKDNNVVYKYINEVPSTGHATSEADYWAVVRTAPIWDFPIVLDPKRYAQMVVDNINRARPNETWTVGYTIDHSPMQATFSNTNCLEALGTISGIFETEFWIGPYTVNIGKRATTTSLTMQYGLEGGLKNITRTEVSNTKKVTRLVALGSERNLQGTYRNGSPRLMLPTTYYIDSSNIDVNNPKEDTVTWDDIYPCMEHAKEDYSAGTTYSLGAQVLYNRISWDYINATPSDGNTPTVGAYWKISEGTVLSAISTLKFSDENLTFNPLDSSYAMTDGTKPKVAFLTGNLAGYEFPISNFDTLTKTITLETIEDGTDNILPAKDYGFAYGDQYFFVDLYMPQSYITKAENRLLAKATEYLEKYSKDQISYRGDVSIIWATANSVNLAIGDLITVVDTDFGINDAYRIISLTRNITNPYKYSIELSQLPYIPSRIESIENSINDNQNQIDRNGSDKQMFKVNTYRGAKEAIDMAFDPEGNYFTEKIKPLIVETSQILIGTSSQQYALTGLVFSTLSSDPNTVSWTAGTITDSTMETSPRAWNIAAGTFVADADPLKSYYCYIVCPRATGAVDSTILFSESQILVKQDNTNYYFLFGTLGKLIDGIRQLWTSKGFTFISGDTIVTGRIKNTDGTVDIDLVNKEINFGTDQKFIRYKDGELETQRLVIRSPYGDSSYAELYVGTYDGNRQYYSGEYFDYSDGNQYICTLTPPSFGVLPTDTTYFRKKTTKGTSGDWVSYVFKNSSTQPSTPTGTNVIPTGWVDSPTGSGTWWMSKAIVSGATGLAGTWSYPVQVTGNTGAAGDRILFKYAQNTSKITPPSISNGTLDPGEIWTLFPPTLLSGEYLWMTSALVNYNATVLVSNWTTPVRISGEHGEDGLPSIALSLTNEYHGIPTDSAGNNGVYTNAYTTLNLYVGGVIQTSGVTTSFSVSNPSITISNPTTFYLAVISMGVDNGYVTCTATYNGISYSKQFKLSKIKSGASGTPGVSYWINASSEIIVKKTVGGTTTYTPSALSFYPRKQVGVSEAVASGTGTTFTMQGWNGTAWINLSSSPYLNPSLLTYTTPSINGTYSQYKGTLLYGSTILDEITIAMVEDAASAKDAMAFQLGGFSSYDAYVTYVSNYGKILMQGGYINANLVDVNALVADAVVVNEMASIAGTYFQTDGVTFTQTNGITLPATINSVATSLDINPQSLPDISAFLTNLSLTGTTNLPLVDVALSDRETISSPSVQASNGYMTIPTGVTSIRSNTVAISGDLSIGGREAGDRTGFVYKCDLFALFYNGTTFLSKLVIGQYSMDSNSDYRGISYTFPSATLAIPNNATRIYLHSEHSLYVKTNIGGDPYGDLYINSVASSAYFYNATGVYKSRISPDGYACARGSDDYFHVKAGSTKMVLNYKGDVISNSIQQKLVSCVFEANGTPRAYGGYGTLSSFTMNRVSIGVYRVVHNMNTSLGLNTNNYIIHATSEVGLVLCYIWPVSSNEFQIKCFNTSGVASDTVLHVSVTRI